TVTWGGSTTLEQIGLKDKLHGANLEVVDRDNAANAGEKAELMRKAFNCDYYLMSSNAITQDGRLVNIDGNGNRVAALCYGPWNVIIIAGMNKVTADEECARKRIRNYAAPMNNMRLDNGILPVFFCPFTVGGMFFACPPHFGMKMSFH
ncbi:MAG: lactate utilization protein, partial [Halanaerobiales bacterium]